ncbi:MAG: 6-phosphofructokinase [Flavobacteriales bacterium]|nr:6-phosphofructokinase [Flavobacteriales bacterium]
MSIETPIRHIGVLTSGGDSPGMNAAVRAIVRSAVQKDIRVTGIIGGYNGLINARYLPLGARDVSNIIQRGGTILRTARSEEFRTPEGRARAARNMQEQGIDALLVIGGDGSFTGARLLFEEHGTRILGLPGTIDNDLFGTDYTIGFDTAINTAVEAIDKIRDTASSHDRLFFIEVMGRNSGFIAQACAVAAGAEFVLIPERPQGIDELVRALAEGAKTKSSSIVIVAEGDEEGGAFDVARKVKQQYDHYDIRVSVLGHMQRGGSPTANDRILASRSGVAAVEYLLAGEHDAMVGVINGRIALTSFGEAIGQQKQPDPELYRILGILAT